MSHERIPHQQMLVCLDLEKTLIDDWHDMTLCPSTKVTLEEFGVTAGFPVEIFSFAVDNLKDILTFNKIWLEDIERIFNITVEHVCHVEQLMIITRLVTGKDIPMHLYKHRGKREAFLEYVRWCESDTDRWCSPDKISYLLFDDMVDDEDILMDTCSVHFIRV